MYSGTESVAYDYSRFDNRQRVREASAAPEAVQQRRQERQREHAADRLKPIVALLFVALIAVVIINNNLKMTELSSQISEAKADLREYQEQEVLLRAEQEKLYSIDKIETYVKNEMGMSQLDKSQMEYIELSNPDKIVRHVEEKDDSQLVGALVKSFNAVVEYLT